MDKNKFVKLGVVGFLAAVGYSAYVTVKQVRAQQEQDVIDITPEEVKIEDTRK